MKLTFDRLDLKPEHKNISCPVVKFQHLTKEAQEALKKVGRGMFYEYDKSNYNAVYAPKGD